METRTAAEADPSGAAEIIGINTTADGGRILIDQKRSRKLGLFGVVGNVKNRKYRTNEKAQREKRFFFCAECSKVIPVSCRK